MTTIQNSNFLLQTLVLYNGFWAGLFLQIELHRVITNSTAHVISSKVMGRNLRRHESVNPDSLFPNGSNCGIEATLLRKCNQLTQIDIQPLLDSWFVWWLPSRNWRPVAYLESRFDTSTEVLRRYRDSNLVDSASSIRLSQRLSHACLSINKSILWNCEWLIISVIVYLMVLTTWITVVILELIHASIPDFWKGCIY